MKTNILMIISSSFLLRMTNVSDMVYRDNQNTHFVSNNFFFFFENLALYEIMWKNMVEVERSLMTI